MSDSIQSKGGQARAAALSPEQRSEIASQAANARWSNRDRNFKLYRLPLKGDRMVEFKTPEDITPAEVERLCAWIKLTLVIDEK